FHVTGVQTCALPISKLDAMLAELRKQLRNDGSDAGQLQSLLDNIDARIKDVDDERGRYGQALQEAIERLISQLLSIRPTRALVRSAERRVGKECSAG